MKRYRQNGPLARSWLITRCDALWHVVLTTPATITYAGGSPAPDTLAAYTPALAPDGIATTVDITSGSFVLYLRCGQAQMRLVEEENLFTLDSGADYATLKWLIGGRLVDRQQ